MEIQGYPNYLIYEDGRVYSKKFKRYLKAHPNTDGYLRLNLYKDGKLRKFSIHRLLAIHYIANPHNYPEVDHIDRNPLNNDLCNLRWADRYIQCNNRKALCIPKNNTSGSKRIVKNRNGWQYRIETKEKKIYKHFKSLNDARWFKFIYETCV